MFENKKEPLDNPKKVLIVDDDFFMVRVLRMKLEKEGFQVLVAHNGYEGLENVKKHNPQVVITDVNMPRMDGWELCRRINQSNNSKPEIIIITSLIDRNKRETIREFPNAKFVDKPVSPRNILKLIQDHFNNVDACENHKS